MKICSRPDETVAGSGPYTLRMDFNELQLIGALMYVTRLGSGSEYREAAHKIINTIEDMFGGDFLDDASSDVNMCVSLVDDDDDTIEQYHNSIIVIEV